MNENRKEVIITFFVKCWALCLDISGDSMVAVFSLICVRDRGEDFKCSQPEVVSLPIISVQDCGGNYVTSIKTILLPHDTVWDGNKELFP